MTGKPQPRLDAEPLLDAAGRWLGTSGDTGSVRATWLTKAEVDRLTMIALRVRKSGGVTEASADTFATMLRMHPAQIWPEWFDDVEQDAA